MNPEDGLELLRSPAAWNLEFHPTPRTADGSGRPVWSWRMIAVSTTVAAAVLAATVVMAATLQPHTPIAGPAPIDTASAVPLPDPATPVYDGMATCDNLLNESTIQEYKAQGWADAEWDMESVARKEGYPQRNFVEYGGIACAWGEYAWITEVFAFGPITPEQEAVEREKLEKWDPTPSHEQGYDIYRVDIGPPPFTVIFGDGTWGFSGGDGGGDVSDDLITNAPR